MAELQKKQAAPTTRRVEARPAEPQTLRSADEAVATVLAREAYTRERHYLLVRVVMGLLLVVCIQAASLLYLGTRPVHNLYFSTGLDGRIVPLIPIDKPINSQGDLTTWVTSSVVQAYTFSFANWRQELNASQTNFTVAGWKSFSAALDSSGLLKSVIGGKYITTAVPTSAPVLVDAGVIKGQFAWKLQMPLLVTFQSSERSTTQTLNIDIIVVRQPQTENPRGLGIAQLLAR